MLTWVCSKNGGNRSYKVSLKPISRMGTSLLPHYIHQSKRGPPRFEKRVEKTHEKRGAVQYCGCWESRKKDFESQLCSKETKKSSGYTLYGMAKVRQNLRSADYILQSSVLFQHCSRNNCVDQNKLVIKKIKNEIN